uniref:Uncharacterized protein n=1 Tax=Ursus maritimus TaxID=29073 RepID=A0A452UX25_URSMA
MKPALLEVMRMNRICRMVLATCLGSFILVIFYFQSMLHPVMRRNPFGVDICCRKGSRSPLQELYNPTQLLENLGNFPKCDSWIQKDGLWVWTSSARSTDKSQDLRPLSRASEEEFRSRTSGTGWVLGLWSSL